MIGLKRAQFIHTKSFDFLALFSDKIVAKLSLKEIVLFKRNLVKLKTISFFCGVFNYASFLEFNSHSLLMYDPEENHQLILLNLHSYQQSMIPLGSAFDNVHFSPVYYWNNKILILTDYDDHFYFIDQVKKSIYPIEGNAIKDRFTLLYDFYFKIKEYKNEGYIIEKIYSEKYQFIYTDERSNKVVFYDFLNDNHFIIPHTFFGAHDYDFRNKTLLVVSDQRLDIVKEGKQITLFPEKKYQMGRAQFVTNDSFALLKLNKSARKANELAIYKILEL